MRILFNHEPLKDDLLPQTPFREGLSTAAQRAADRAVHLLRRAGIGLRRLLRDIERRRQARANYEVLRRLDPATLRDIGVSPDNLEAVAAEAAGIAERTRRRVEEEFWHSASAGFRVRKAEMFLSFVVLSAFVGVVSAAFYAPEVVAAWRATVIFV
jgi:uncharacterized protein YjiS (DUF1127 family)